MFEHHMQESNTNSTVVADIEPEVSFYLKFKTSFHFYLQVMRELLLYMYTGQSKNLEMMAQPLIAAADKYQLDRLKVCLF